jgi:hypothetical protein
MKKYMKKFLNSDWLRSVQCFRNTVPKNETRWEKKKYSANLIDYLGFLIGFKHETITKIANMIQQFPAELIQTVNKHLA